MNRAKIDIYRNGSRWHWLLISPNNRIIAQGSDSYGSRRKAVESVRKTSLYLWHTPIPTGGRHE